MAELAGIYPKSLGLTWEQFTGFLASTAHTRRVMALDEVANMAVFTASDKASGMTGTTVNLTMGGGRLAPVAARTQSTVRGCSEDSPTPGPQTAGSTTKGNP